LFVVGRPLFFRSSEPPSAASEPGLILTPKGWEFDNRRQNAAGGLTHSRLTMHRNNAHAPQGQRKGS
jgi:hypothetical protein